MAAIALVNQKGGVGKTTVSLGLAAAAAHAGMRVLVVDLDPQANATTGLGVWDATETMDQALAEDRPGVVARISRPAGWDGDANPDVAPSSPILAQREPQLATDPIGAQDRLRIALEGVDHDLVLIDCPPSLGLLTVNGLFAADRALVVTEPAAWARDGVEQVMRTIERVSARRAAPLDVAGVVVNRLGRTRDARYWFEQLQGDYADLVLPAIQMRAAVTEASAQSTSLYALGTRAGAREAAEQFEALLEAVLSSSAPSSESTPEPDAEAITTLGSVQTGPVDVADDPVAVAKTATPDSVPAVPEEMNHERVRPSTVAISTTPG